MTFPLPDPDGEPGESEFCHGKGLRPSARQRGQRNANFELAYPTADIEGPWEPDVYERGKAVQRSDPALAGSVADLAAPAFSDNNTTGTQWVRES